MTQRRNYTLNMEETNGVFRIVSAEVLQPINQYQQKLKRVDARDLARKIKKGTVTAR
jgi:hypothetical protein